MGCQLFLREIYYKEHTECNFNISDFIPRNNVLMLNRVDIFETAATCSGRSDVSQAVARPSRMQLCAVLGSSGTKLSEYVCNTK